jgi:RNA polymerase sigma-70 factor (ECF subfamily)
MPSRDLKFATTVWSLVSTAQSEVAISESPAMELLCGQYWFPLYGYVRQLGYSPSESQDLTQAFFERFLEKHYVLTVNRGRGRFRSFLLTALKHFLSDFRDRQKAIKRGGDSIWLSWEAEAAEERFEIQSRDHLSPELNFDRRWAYAVLDAAQLRLKSEFIDSDRQRLCELLSAGMCSYAEVATQCGMTVSGVKAAAHRFRQRYQHLVREEIGRTLSRREDVDDEIRYLLSLVTTS